MRTLILSILLLLSGAATAQVYETPVLHCLQVDAADDVTLTWQGVANSSGEFDFYRLIRKEQFIDEVYVINNLFQTTYLDVNASANEIEFYCLEAVYDSMGVEVVRRSAVLKTLNPNANAFGNSLSMSWQRPTTEVDSSMYTFFEVQMNYTGAWETLTTQPYWDTTLVYLSEICPEPPATDVDIDFRVVLYDIFGCTSISTERDDVAPMFDDNPPTPPVIETVTFDTTLQRPVVCWFRPPEGDVGGYIIQYLDAVDAGQVNDPDVLSFVDPDIGSNFLFNSVGYVVLAYDTCGANATTALDGEPHYTIRLEVEYNKCEQVAELDWNPYINWEGGVDYYVVYSGLFGGPLMPLDTLPPGQTSYLDQGLPAYTDLTYLVKAVSVNGFKSSLSLKEQLYTDYPETPDFTYLANVSVTGARQVELKALPGSAADGTQYRFEKLNQFGDEFLTLGSLPQNAVGLDGFILWYDTEAFPSASIHDYRVVSIDSCGNEHGISPISSNILASVDIDNLARTNTIRWQGYSFWEGQVMAYNVYEVNNGVVGDLLATLPASERSYIDLVDTDDDYTLDDAQYCYLIEAIEGPQFIGPSQLSRSNIVCATQEPLMFIPNVITPNGDGLNDSFGPVAGYLDRNNGYTMTIYDRWGHAMYETDNFYRTWAPDKDDVPEGVYVYSIKYRTGGGQLYERNGTVTVLYSATE